MKIDIYKSNKNGNKFLSVISGSDVSKLQLPEDIDTDLLTLSLFKEGLELDPSKPRIAMDEVNIENQINEKGYAIHQAKIESKIIP